MFVVYDGAGLTVTGNGTIDINAHDTNPDVAYMFFAHGKGTLTIENGTYHADNLADSMFYAHGSKTITVNGGTFVLDMTGTRENGSPWIFNVQGRNEGAVVVNGGTFNADVDSQHWKHEVAVKEGYCAQPNGNGTWTIKAHVEETIPAVPPTYTTVGWTEGVKCSDCGKILVAPVEIPVLFAVAQNTNTGAYYNDVSDALMFATSGQTVILLVDGQTEAMLMVPAGVTFNLNGHTITAGNVFSFGHIIDNNGTTDGVGGILISNDRTKAFVQLQQTNNYLPIYDTANGCYRFFGYEFVSMGAKLSGTNTVKYGVALKFTNVDAFKLLAETADSGLTISLQLTWNGAAAPMVYTFDADTVKTFATNAYIKYSDPNYTGTRTLTLTVHGLDALDDGVVLNATPILASTTGLSTTAATIPSN
jgi:hypothetical protein